MTLRIAGIKDTKGSTWAWFIDSQKWKAGKLPEKTPTTRQQLELYALLQALREVTPRSLLKVITSDKSMIKLFGSNGQGGFVGSISRNNWEQPSGKPVPYLKLLQSIHNLIVGRDIQFIEGDSKLPNRAYDAATSCLKKPYGASFGPGFNALATSVGVSKRPSSSARRSAVMPQKRTTSMTRRKPKEFIITSFDDGEDLKVIKKQDAKELITCTACGSVIDAVTNECRGCSK